MINKPREIALKTIYKINQEQAYSNLALDEELKQNRKILNEKDIGLISEITYGVTTWKLTLDTIIKKHSKIKLKKISPWIINILRMGIYQIIFLDKIPKSAAVNESVNLAKRYGHTSSSNFVNAILRKVEKEDYEELFQIKNNVERISKTTSMPEWIVKKLIEDNGLEKTKEICESSNLHPKVTIRINKLKNTKQELENSLKEKNIEFQETEYEDFLILERVKNLENMDLFKAGNFTIQDISAGLTAKVLEPKENENVLDACSAPGGKTTYMAELMNNKGNIEAWDIHEHRTKLVMENAKRLGINIITTNTKDATKYYKELNGKFDKILLDVPCLGIGVIKRKPDIKWHRKPEDLKVISKVQYEILENCSKYVKKGGTIIYSTCSILEKENHGIIQKFLEKNPIYTTTEIKIEPTEKQDGFYIAKLIKK